MRNIFITFVLLMSVCLCNAQNKTKYEREMQALKELNNMREKEEAQELDATEKVLSYRSIVKQEMRRARSNISKSNYEKLERIEKGAWTFHGPPENKNYYEFYRNYLYRLEMYKDYILDLIIEYKVTSEK